jgi:hypothetical protein
MTNPRHPNLGVSADPPLHAGSAPRLRRGGLARADRRKNAALPVAAAIAAIPKPPPPTPPTPPPCGRRDAAFVDRLTLAEDHAAMADGRSRSRCPTPWARSVT